MPLDAEAEGGPSLAPADVNDEATALGPVPPPAVDSVATLLPPSLDQVLLMTRDTSALYQETPRSTKRHVGEEITVSGPDRHGLRRR